MDIIFQHLYEEVYGCIKEGRSQYGTNTIIFPQNFIPVPGVKYKNLRVQTTLTGEFKFNGKIYDVSRAYHSDYDLDGNPIDKTGGIIDIIDFKYENKDRRVKIGNGFAELSKIKEQLPNQK